MEAMLRWCAMWKRRPKDSVSLRIAHHNISTRAVGFGRKDCTEDSLEAVLDMTNCQLNVADYAQTSTSVRAARCPAERNASPEVHHVRAVSRIRTQERWSALETLEIPPPR